MVSVRFLSITKLEGADPCSLEPAPSVSDWEAISLALLGGTVIDSADSLIGGAHEIRGSYRGGQMYLYPNVRFNRNGAPGMHGFTFWPNKGDQENVDLRISGVMYEARVEYV